MKRGKKWISNKYVQDRRTQLAKKQGYPARSVFKLKEIDEKFKLFKSGQRVLDLGCSPGSWTLYAAQKIGVKGVVLGVDLNPPSQTTTFPPNCRIIKKDVNKMKLDGIVSSFDVVLSDMAPSTTGIKDVDNTAAKELSLRALDVARTVLRGEAMFVTKNFMGSECQELIVEIQKSFKKTNIVQVQGTRKGSREMFIVAHGRTRKTASGTK